MLSIFAALRVNSAKDLRIHRARTVAEVPGQRHVDRIEKRGRHRSEDRIEKRGRRHRSEDRGRGARAEAEKRGQRQRNEDGASPVPTYTSLARAVMLSIFAALRVNSAKQLGPSSEDSG